MRRAGAAMVLLLQMVCVAGVEAGESAAENAQVRLVLAEYARVRQDLAGAQGLLPKLREELAKLRHKWVVTKGRTPTEKEMKDFEEKLAKGKAKPEENPYFNQTPLTTPAPARSAYYAKLEELRRTEDRVRALQEELSALDQKAAAAAVPVELRR